MLYYNGSLIGVSIGLHNIGVGKFSDGAIFALNESAKGKWSMQVWHTFQGTVSKRSKNGREPQSPLILGLDGRMYGVTYFGGTSDTGTVYKINPANTDLTTLYSFPAPFGPANYPDTALLQAGDGNFYGSTQGGGISNGGEIFKMTPGGQVTTLYMFPFPVFLQGPLIQGADGNFYGSTGDTVFQMTPAAAVTVLHTFGQGTDGKGASGVIFGPNGNLYGTTGLGGTAGQGTVFELSTDGTFYTVLHNFGDGSVPNDGAFPFVPLVLGADNNLYGTTSGGGSANLGTVFRISP